MATLSLQAVRKVFGSMPVVHGLDLEVADREFIVLVGPSGCGKSTVLRMIAGLEETSGGRILIDGAVVNEREPKDRDIAMVFQDYALYPHMTVAENMAFALRYRGTPRAATRRRVEETARLLEITPLLDRTPRQLSGGQRQRVAMGRAIVRDPKIFLFDEPLSNLDAKLRGQMRTEIRKLRERVPTTTVYVTHDQVEAMTLADRIVVMNGGRVEQVGAPDAVYDRPASAFVAGFMGAPAMNLLPARLERGAAVLADGTRLAAPGAGASAAEVLCGIRPEDLVWIGERDEAAALRGRAIAVEPLGADTLVTIAVGGAEIAARLPPRSVRHTGEIVALSLDPERLHLFARDTGRRLPS